MNSAFARRLVAIVLVLPFVTAGFLVHANPRALQIVSFGENTWNQVTSNATISRTTTHGYLVRLHLGSVINKDQHTAVIRYLQDPASETARRNMRDVLKSIHSRDHHDALTLLGEAVFQQHATHWEFRPHADTNDLGSFYRIDIVTEADIELADLLAIQRYLDERHPGGKQALRRIFVEQRNDAAAIEILDLND